MLLNFSEGLLVTCSYDYMSVDWNRKSFLLYAFIGNYCIPMVIMIFFYIKIVKAVIMHEAALKLQAKKMNVESLRSNVSTWITLYYQRRPQLMEMKILSSGKRWWRKCRGENCQSCHHQCFDLGCRLDSVCCCCNDWLLWKQTLCYSFGGSNSLFWSQNSLYLQPFGFCIQPSQVSTSSERQMSLLGNQREWWFYWRWLQNC